MRKDSPRNRAPLPLAPPVRLRGLRGSKGCPTSESVQAVPPPAIPLLHQENHGSSFPSHLVGRVCLPRFTFLGQPTWVSLPSSSDTDVGVTIPTLGQEPHLFSISQCPAHSRCPMLAGLYSFPSVAVSLGGLEAHPHLCPTVGAQSSS